MVTGEAGVGEGAGVTAAGPRRDAGTPQARTNGSRRESREAGDAGQTRNRIALSLSREGVGRFLGAGDLALRPKWSSD
jgi:hypothetical protein